MLHPAVRSLRILVLIELGIAVCAYFLDVYLSKEDAFVGTCLLISFTLYEQDRKTVVSLLLFFSKLVLEGTNHRPSQILIRAKHANLTRPSVPAFLTTQ